MEVLLKFEVPGEPVAKGRPKFARIGAGVRAYTPKATEKAEGNVRLFAYQAMAGRAPFDGPLALEMWAYRSKGMPRPGKTGPGKELLAMLEGRIAPTTKPDGDNYLKMVSDACNGVVYVDDALLVDTTIRRRYSDRPRLEVTLYRWGT